MTSTLALSAADEGTLRAILDAYLPAHVRVGVFGSRAAGQPKPWSDIDLALSGPEKLPLSLLAELREAFDESELGPKVDLVDRACVSAEFDRIIGETLRPLR